MGSPATDPALETMSTELKRGTFRARWQPIAKRVVLPVLLIAVALVFTWWPAVDIFAAGHVDAALSRALIAFALARTLNGVISVAQSTEVAFQPAGVGVSMHPGELLDPVNDLIESFSSVMLLAAGSLGLQKLLIGVSSWLPLKIVLTVVLAGVLIIILRTKHGGTATTRRIGRIAVLLLVLRFAVPLASLASEGAYRIFLEPEYERSRIALDEARITLRTDTEALQPPPPPDASLIERAQSWMQEKAELFDVTARIEQIERVANEMTRQVINLIVVFVLQTLLLPLAFLWLVIRVARVMLILLLAPA
jgi:hypothetical protein